jgi:L-2-hydroxyglutarate oxidase LhgO
VPGLLLPRFGDETAIAQQELCQALTAAGGRAEWCDAAASLEPRINPAVRPAAWIPGAATVNAGRLTVAQARAAELAGASICPEWPVHKILRQGSPVTGMTNGSAGSAALARYHAAESLSDPAEPYDGTSAGSRSTSTGQPGRDPHSGIAYVLAAADQQPRTEHPLARVRTSLLVGPLPCRSAAPRAGCRRMSTTLCYQYQGVDVHAPRYPAVRGAVLGQSRLGPCSS